MIDHALRYVSRGWWVFPVKTRSKMPLTRTGFREATDDPDQIHRWWSDHRTANIGVACGASRIIVVDVDLPHGPESIRALDIYYTIDWMFEHSREATVADLVEALTSEGAIEVEVAKKYGVWVRFAAADRLHTLSETLEPGTYLVIRLDGEGTKEP